MKSNSSGRGDVGQLKAQGELDGASMDSGQQDLSQVEDSFYAWRRVLQGAAVDRPIDFNELTATGKQAALSLKNEAKLKIELRNGRTVVTGRPSFVDRLFALG